MVRSSKHKMINKEAGVDSQFKIKNVLNLLLNPAAGFPGMGDIYYPFKTSAPTWGPTALHAAALATTYGGLAYLIRSMSYKSKIKAKTDEEKKKIAAYINAEMPIVSPEPLTDPEKEIIESEKGTEKLAMLTKSADLNAWINLLIPVLAVTGGSYAGYKLADKEYSDKEKELSQQELAYLKDQLDKLNYEKLKLGRGLEKQADLNFLKIRPSALFKWNLRVKNSGKHAEKELATEEANRDLPGFVKAIIGLFVGGTALASAYFSKQYFDDRDESRQALKAIEKAIKERAAVESQQAPVVVPRMPSKYVKKLEKYVEESAQPARIAGRVDVSAPQLPATPLRIDATDPVMSKLLR